MLRFEVREGWEPLCGFLGCRCPTSRFRG
ncbi:sulfotransferase [Sphaerisporangium sp. NPDC049002]